MRSYLEQVEAFFVATVRRGLALRPADVDVVRDWEARGVPFEVVRRGIEVGVKRFLESAEPRRPIPAVLKFYRVHVEAEWEAYRRALAQGALPVERPAGGPGRDLASEAVALLSRRRAEARTPGEAAAIDRAMARVKAAAAGGALVAELATVDDLLASAAIEAFPDLAARVRASVAAAAARGLGAAAMEDIRRAETRAAAAETGYKSLVEALLAGGG